MKKLDLSTDKMIVRCNPSWEDADWLTEFIKNSDGTYLANLWLKDDYEGYLAQWKHYKTSPNFPTKEGAKAYVLEHWNGKEIG